LRHRNTVTMVGTSETEHFAFVRATDSKRMHHSEFSCVLSTSKCDSLEHTGGNGPESSLNLGSCVLVDCVGSIKARVDDVKIPCFL